MRNIFKMVMMLFVLISFLAMLGVCLAEEYSNDKNLSIPDKNRVTVLEKIVVTATTNNVKLLDTPGTVNIFTAEDIGKGGYVNVADVINGLPGITNDTTNPATPKYNFRGTAYPHSRGATVYVDGKEINIGRIGYGDLNYVDLNDVEQIQVIKTPGSQFAEPSRGVIYITTKKGKKNGHNQRIQAKYGSWGLHSENISAWGKEAFDYRVSAMNKGGDGYRNTKDERKGINLKTGYSFDENTRLGFGGGFQDQSYFSNTSLKKWQWDRDPRDNTPPNDKDNPTYNLLPSEYNIQIYDVFTEFNTEKEHWLAKSMLSYMHNETEYLSQKKKNKPSYAGGNDTSTYSRNFDEDRLTFKASGGYKFVRDKFWDTLTIGIEFDDHDYDQVRTYPFLNELDATRIKYMSQYDLDISIDRISVFLNNDLRLHEHISLQTGLRYDNVELSFENRYPDDPDVENTYNKTSWNISPSYSFTGRDNLYFTVSQSYFYPNIDYTRMSAQKHDEYPENDPGNLKPEDILTYEVGFKHRLHQFFNYSIAIFHMTVEDKFIFQYRYDEEEEKWASLGACNLGRAVHKGIEFELDGQPADWFGYRLNYGYLQAEWDDPDVRYRSYIWEHNPTDDHMEEMSIDGKTLSRIPKHKVGATLSFYPIRNLTVWLNINYVDDQYVDYLERVVQPSLTTLDFKLAYRWDKGRLGSLAWEGITLHGLVKNLTNKDYAYYSNSRGARNDDGTLDTNYYIYPGRYFEAGLTIDF